MLLIYGADQLQSSGGSISLTCEICGQTLDSEEALHQHLIQDHHLASARWNPSRDSIDGGSGCAHCGQIFSNLESLRSHVTQGRCPSYDPRRTSEPREPDPRIIEAMCDGGFNQAMQDSHYRMQLTLHCQCCDMRYTRGGDLMLHLQSCHSQLWHDSANLTHLMMGMLGLTFGCLCNPSVSTRRLNHICLPIRQMAMQYLRLQPSHVFMPLLITESMLGKMYHAAVPRDLKFALDRTMIDRNFDPLLTDSTLMSLLSKHCLICAQAMDTMDLSMHLREAHQCSTPLVGFFLDQIAPLMMQHNPLDHACPHCDMIFNLPLQSLLSNTSDTSHLSDRVLVARHHYRAVCPCALQLAIALCRVFNNGRLHHDGRTLGTGSTLELLQELRGNPNHQGRVPESEPEPGTSEAPAKRSRNQRQGKNQGRARTSRSRPASPPDDGPPDDSARSRTPVPPSRKHIHFFLRQPGQDRELDMPIEISGDMEDAVPADSTTPAVASSPPDSDAGIVQRVAHPPEQIGRSRSPIRPDSGGEEESDPVGRLPMPISGVERCSGETPGQPETSVVSQAAEPDRAGDPGDADIGEPGGGLPLPAGEGNDFSVEAAVESEGGSGILPDEIPVQLGHLDPDVGQHEEPLHASVSPGDTTGRESAVVPLERQREGEGSEAETEGGNLTPLVDRHQMLDLVAHSALQNPNNWCFANSTVMALLWCSLSLRTFDMSVWGAFFRTLYGFVLSLSEGVQNLAHESWFQQVLQTWGRSIMASVEHHISQQDAAEFVSSWLEQMHMHIFDMRWERRLENEGIVELIDASARSCPLNLQFSTFQLQLRQSSIQSLVTVWCEANGMVAALLEPAACICIHVERCVATAKPPYVTKCTVLLDPEEDVMLPMFSSEGLDTDMIEYMVVAAQAHVGTDSAGHYRTALRIVPSVTKGIVPSAWLLCDDARVPEPVWMLPRWFMQHLTLLWLVRSDLVDLHCYADAATTTAMEVPPDIAPERSSASTAMT